MSGGNSYINSHTLYQQNGLRSLNISKNIDDSDMNGDLKNSDASCGNGSINSQNLSQCNESSSFNITDGDVENGDASGGNCFTKVKLYLKKRNQVT